MEARLVRAAMVAVSLGCLGASYRTPNFVVTAATDEIARSVGNEAEKCRRELAVQWLGKPMPNWSQPCPITVQVAENLGAGGATSFVFNQGEVFGWQMNIQGSLERVLDSVLPHEVTHTVFASHFRQPLPRWADEGGCTTVEHASERVKQQKLLIMFLRTGRGIPFSEMFAMKDYPRDILPLYAQGHSLASFLVAQGGRPKFLNYLGEGMQSGQWVEVTSRHYGYSNLGELQNQWLDWVRRGSPPLKQATDDGKNLAANNARPRPGSNVIVRGQSPDPVTSSSPVVPVQARGPAPAPASEERVAAATSGWHAAGTHKTSEVAARPVTPVAGSPDAATSTPRRKILEWSRPQEPAPAATAGSPDAGRSVYETSSAPPQTLLR